MEMRRAGSTPKQAALSSGHNERQKRGKYRFTMCVCVCVCVCAPCSFWPVCVCVCFLLGIHKRTQDLCDEDCSCCCWAVVNQPHSWSSKGSADAPKMALNGSEPSHWSHVAYSKMQPFVLKRDQNLNQGINSSSRHQLGSIRQTLIENYEERVKEKEEKGTKSSSPPPCI